MNRKWSASARYAAALTDWFPWAYLQEHRELPATPDNPRPKTQQIRVDDLRREAICEDRLTKERAHSDMGVTHMKMTEASINAAIDKAAEHNRPSKTRA